MVTGQIFRVEMVSAARSTRYYVLRVIYAALILFVLWAVYINTSAPAWGNAPGQGLSISELAQAAAIFFYSFSMLQIIGLLAVAPAMAVGTIATERERRTIEYLFATDLSNLEIILGKTFAKLLVVAKFALVSMPILFLFRLMGGIPADLLAASFLIAGSTALFVTSLSVCISVWSKRSRDASIRVYLVLAALLFLPPVLMGALGWTLGGAQWWTEYVMPVLGFMVDLNPVAVLGRSMGGVWGLGAGFHFDPVLKMVGWHAAISVGLVALATAAVRRVHLRELGRGSPTKTRRFRLPSLPHWRPKIGDSPVLWKEAFAATAKTRLGIVGGLAVFAIAVTALGFVIYVYFETLDNVRRGSTFGNRIPYYGFLIPFTGFIGVGMLILVAARASGLITVEKERDCWTSLISTPLTAGEIIRGKTLGNLYSARWGFALLAFGWLLGITFNFNFLFIAIAMGLAFLLCAWFVTNFGLLYSMKSKTSLRSMGFTLGVCFFIGGGYLLCCCPVMAATGNPDEGFMLGFAPCMPYLMMFPLIAFSEGMVSREMNVAGPAYVIGMIGYLIACAVLASYLTNEFDTLAGRTGSVPDGRPVD